MLRSTQTITGFEIGATDGVIGTVDRALFDDARWAIRYLVTDTGDWLSGRKVLISPRSIWAIDGTNQVVRVGLTRDQVANGPSIDVDKPVARQHEIAYSQYYGHAPYWGGPLLWGTSGAPIAPPIPEPGSRAVPARVEQPGDAADEHLRASNEVAGYYVAATDGDIGHVEDFLFDDETWAIHYLVIDTRNWLPGKRVLVSPEWFEEIDWSERKVIATVSRAAIKHSPEYNAASVEREYEEALHRHYRKPTYWGTRDEPVTPLSMR